MTNSSQNSRASSKIDTNMLEKPTSIESGVDPKSYEQDFSYNKPISPVSSDDADNGSDNGSEDSEMEPFSDYLPKIERLLSDIGLDGFSVESLQHGYTFQNSVYALTSEDGQEQYVLRVPVCPDFGESEVCEAIVNEASLLGHLADKLSVPIPRVKAYSATTQNALETPFSIQTRLPGQSLDKVYEDLSQADKLVILDQFVGLLAKLESVNFDAAGTFSSPPAVPNSTNDFRATTSTTPLINIFDGGDEEFVKDPKCLQDRAGPDVKTLLVSQLNGLITKELKGDEVHRSILVPPFQRLLAMIDDLYHGRSHEDGRCANVLYHWDLEPRNIMVKRSSGSGAWEICGIIDWDDAMVVPTMLARRPPAWIWDFDPEEFTGYLDNDFHPNNNLSEESTALKAQFDARAAAALPNYLEDAYGRGRWLRRTWTLVKDGIHSPWYLDLMEQMLKEWGARPKPPRFEEPKGLWKKALDWSPDWLSSAIARISFSEF